MSNFFFLIIHPLMTELTAILMALQMLLFGDGNLRKKALLIFCDRNNVPSIFLVQKKDNEPNVHHIQPEYTLTCCEGNMTPVQTKTTAIMSYRQLTAN